MIWTSIRVQDLKLFTHKVLVQPKVGPLKDTWWHGAQTQTPAEPLTCPSGLLRYLSNRAFLQALHYRRPTLSLPSRVALGCTATKRIWVGRGNSRKRGQQVVPFTASNAPPKVQRVYFEARLSLSCDLLVWEGLLGSSAKCARNKVGGGYD